MLKTIVIDDEDIIREGLLNSINWNEIGYTIVAQATDGEEAIELIQEFRPDVIITDIRMPFMNGLELIEFIKPMLPNAFIVVLSGHDEFHYAQKALQLGVYDFILKPFDLDYFIKVLMKIKYDYTLKKNSNKVIRNEDLYTLQSRLFEDIIFNRIDSETIEKKLAEYNLLELRNTYFSIIIVQLDHYHVFVDDYSFDQITELHKNYYGQINDAIDDITDAFLIEGNSGNCIICLTNKEENSIRRKTSEISNKLKSKIEDNLKMTVTIASSDVNHTINNLGTAYKQSLECLDHRYIIGYGNVISYENIKKKNNQAIKFNYPQIEYNKDIFISLIKSGSTEDITSYIDNLFKKIIDRGHNSPLFIMIFISSVYLDIINLLNTMDLYVNDVFSNPVEIHKTLTAPQTITETNKLLKEVAVKVNNYISSKRSIKSNVYILKAKEYIDNNYALQDLTLQNVAEHVNMGVCYFSSIFRKELGEPFITYLTSVRINKAKELFETTDLKTYEIAYLVGYNNPTYFSTLFKKITGISPSQYRNQN